MASCGEGGVPMRFLDPMGLGCGKTLREGGGGDFSRFVRFEVGDESKIELWQDIWCGDQSLKASFLVLFNIDHFKEASVADYMLFPNDTFKWNITFVRLVHDWEVEKVT
jgi:hypothetical protein